MAKAKKKTKKNKLTLRGRIMMIGLLITGLVFYKVAILLVIGMLPTIVIGLVDKSSDRTKVMTIGFMNFAGCFPFCYQIFEKHQDPSSIVSILTSPVDIIIMYSAAGLGYIIEWGIVGFVASLMVSKGRQRLVNIKKTQEDQVKKWGPEVTGELSLDAQGFSID